MKRRSHPMGRTGVSCYQRHNKSPYKYSMYYAAWKHSVVESTNITRAAAAHDKFVFAVKSNTWLKKRM